MRQSKIIAVNTASNWASIFFNAIVLVFLTKFLLNRLGDTSYGMFQYVIALQSSILFLDLGIGATLNRYVSQFSVVSDTQRLNSIISVSLAFFLGLGILSGAVMTILGLFLPQLITQGTAELYRSAFVLAICIGLMLMIRFWGYVPQSILFGLQRHYLVSIIGIASIALRALLIVGLFLAFENSGLVTIGICFLAGGVLETALMWTFAKWQYPALKFSFKSITKSSVKEILRFSFYVMLSAITTMLIVNAPTFLAGRWFGADAVAFMALPALALNLLQRFSGGFAFALIPVAGTKKALKDHDALRRLTVTGTKFCAAMCIPMAVLVAIYGYPLFEWFKKGFGDSSVLFAIMMPAILLRTTQRVPFSVLIGAGSVKWLALGQILVVAVIGAASWILAIFFDMKLIGIAVGFAIPVFVFGFLFQPIYACLQIGIKWSEYMIRSYGGALACAVPMAATAVMLRTFIAYNGIIMIIMQGLASLAVFIVCVWFFALSDGDREQIFSLFKRKAQ